MSVIQIDYPNCKFNSLVELNKYSNYTSKQCCFNIYAYFINTCYVDNLRNQ